MSQLARRFVVIGSVTAAVAATGLGIAIPSAMAGGFKPAPIVAPHGFAQSYANQAGLVRDTCNLSGPLVSIAQVLFSVNETKIDARLAQHGFAASPTYFDFTSQPLGNLASGCILG